MTRGYDGTAKHSCELGSQLLGVGGTNMVKRVPTECDRLFIAQDGDERRDKDREVDIVKRKVTVALCRVTEFACCSRVSLVPVSCMIADNLPSSNLRLLAVQ